MTVEELFRKLALIKNRQAKVYVKNESGTIVLLEHVNIYSDEDGYCYPVKTDDKNVSIVELG